MVEDCQSPSRRRTDEESRDDIFRSGTTVAFSYAAGVCPKGGDGDGRCGDKGKGIKGVDLLKADQSYDSRPYWKWDVRMSSV